MDRMIDQLCDKLELAWQNGDRPTIESFLEGAPTLDRNALLYELVRLESSLRQAAGETPSRDAYLRRFPDDNAVIESAFGETVFGNKSTGHKSDPLDATTDHSSDSTASWPSLAETVASQDSPGETIGRYRTQATPRRRSLWQRLARL